MKTPHIPVLLLLLFIFFQLHGSVNNIILDKDKIVSNGSYRVGDIIRFSEGIGFRTIDGYTYRYSFSGLNDYQHQNYSIYIDNHKLDFGFLGNININALPINLNSIDSVIIISEPQMYNGNFENNGVIHFFTNRNKKDKIYLNNTGIAGNETQDSGPYRYTKYKTPNVDKIGYNYSGSIGSNYKEHNLLTSIHYRQNIYTDWAIRQRIDDLGMTKKWPMLIDYGGSLNCIGEVKNVPYSLFLSRVNAENMFHFFEPAGHEFPLDYINNHFSLSIDKNINNNFQINSKIKYTNESAQVYREMSTKKNYNSLNNFNANIEIKLLKYKLLNTFGFGVNRLELFSTQNNYEQQKLVPKFYLNFHFQSKIFGDININEFFQYNEKNIYDNYLISSHKKFSEKSEIFIILSRVKEVMPLTSNNLWEKGYMFPNTNYVGNNNSKENEKYTADFSGKFHFNNSILLNITLFSRYFSDYTFRKQNFNFINENCSLQTPIVEHKIANGIVNGFKAHLKWKYSKDLDFSLNYTLQEYYSNDEIFIDIWSQIPTNTINYGIYYAPSKTFSIWFNIHQRSKTLWQDYKNISGIIFLDTYKEEFEYNYILNSSHRIDMHLKKKFFNNRLAANLILRNITNQKIYYYPIGASFDMSMFVGLEYYFPNN